LIANITAPIVIGQSSSYYTLREAEGFGSAGVEITSWNRPGFHGIKIPSAFWRERIIRLIIGVRAADSATYEQKRRDLQEAFDFPRNGLTWLKFTTQGGLELQCQVQLNSQIQAPLRGGEVTIGTFRIELIAQDPVFYSQTETEEDITFADETGIITNSGNAPIFPTVKIHGSIQNPGIQNATIGRTLSLDGITIAAGHYYNVDMLEETIKDEVGTSRYSYINSDDFFWLDKGNNTINLTGTPGGSGYRKATFTYRNGYLGI